MLTLNNGVIDSSPSFLQDLFMPPANKKVREYALEILHRVDTQKSYANLLLNSVPDDDSQQMRPFLTQLVKGTLEWRSRIDHRLQPLLQTPLEKMNPWVRNALRLGAYEVLFLDKVPKEVSVNEAVNLAKKYARGKSSGGLVNAVLRKIAATPHASGPEASPSIEDMAASLSHPQWLLTLWAEQLGLEEARKLCEANNSRWVRCIRANTLRISAADLRDELAKEGVECAPGRYDPDCLYVTATPKGLSLPRLSSFARGLFTIQDESSALVARLLGAAPGEFLIDLCSAPGGKAAASAAFMGDKGVIAAVDPHPNRLRLVNELCGRLGITSVHPLAADGRSVSFGSPADKILIDAPCSGLGTLGNKADLRWQKKEEDIGSLVHLQWELLEHAASLLREGGSMVYSSCTINRHENQDIVRHFLEAHDDFVLVPATEVLQDEVTTPEGFLQTIPHSHGIAGAFGALLMKKAGGFALR